MLKLKKTVAILFSTLIIFAACSDDNKSGTGTLELRLTDAPADYEEVWIDIQEIYVNVTDDEDGNWINLDDVKTGKYNLLDLTNGNDTLLTSCDLPTGKIHQIRLVLGDDNQVKVDGEYHDMKAPSASTSGLKLNVQATIEDGVIYKMWLDFDAARSIVETGNGKYILKPVIRVFTKATSGAISGVITPVAAKPYILAVSTANDSLGTYADTITGAFMLAGAPEGTYTIKIEPRTSYETVSVTNVEVSLGSVTELDPIVLDPIGMD